MTANATLTDRESVTPDLAVFHLTLDEPLPAPKSGAPAFIPGQYLTVTMTAAQGEEVRRPLTIASAPHAPQHLQFLVNRVTQPASALPLSHLLFNLPIGGRVHVRPAATGHFTLPGTAGESGPVLMVGAGTGVAPFLSMLRDRQLRGLSCQGWALVHVVNHLEEVVAAQELRTLAGLQHHVIVGDPQAVFEARQSIEAQVGLPLDPDRTPVMACGLGAQLRGLSLALMGHGYMPQHRRLRAALQVPSDYPVRLFLEQYDAERLFRTRDPQDIERLKRSWHARREMP